jgi:hypothetical protein
MSSQTSANCKLYIGTTATATSITEYEADTYEAVGQIEDLGEFGDQVSAVTFITLEDGRVRKYKGSRDAGDMNLVVGFDPDDAGQDAIKAALDDTTSADYNIKVELDDPLTPSTGTPTTFLFSGKIMSRRIQIGSADNIIRANVTIGLNSPIFEKAAT